MIKASVVADSIAPSGDRLTSLLITFPRIILAELNTHRMLSKNSASSRAIPFDKMVKSVQENPFIPIAWQKDHKGMQGVEYWEEGVQFPRERWLIARDNAVNLAKDLSESGITKQLCNRLLEPFMYHTVLITGNVNSDAWINFFNLRCPQYYTPVSGEGYFARSWKELQSWHSDPLNIKLLEENKDNTLFKLQHNKGLAEIHMMQLAECIFDAIQESAPKTLQAGEWHIPFEEKILEILPPTLPIREGLTLEEGLAEFMYKISTSMSARTSYTVVGDEKEVSYNKHVELYEKLINQRPLHASPMEHASRAMSENEYESYYRGYGAYIGDTGLLENQGWCRNYRGFIQLREILENKL